MAMQKLNVRFSDEVKDKISSLAAELGLSDSQVARDAMKEGLFYLAEELRFIRDTDQEGDAHLQDDLLK